MSGKPRNFLLNAKVDEGIDSACNSIEEKIHFLFFLLMYEYSEEDSL
jgi:hypothetical protein